MPHPQVSDEELQLDVQAYYDAAGNKSEAARARGLKRITYHDHLVYAEKRLGFRAGKVADGRIGQTEAEQYDLPPRGHVNRYIITSVQNNTHLHPGWLNLLAYAQWLDGLEDGSCRLMVGTYSYQKASYGKKAVKRGTYRGDDGEKEWYAPEVEEYVVDGMVELAPGLMWSGNFNILPTAKNPLTGLDTYNGRRSNIVPHAQTAMESVASMQDEATKFNYTTGTITQRNYLQKRAGIVAEQTHCYGAVIVEVDSDGCWWVRQLEIGQDDAVYDAGPDPVVGGLRVQAGEVKAVDLVDRSFVESVNWGDAHASEMEMWVRELAWSTNPDGHSMIDTLRPRYQFMHDVFSMRSRGHHEMKDFHRTYAKHADAEETVLEEMEVTADLLREAGRDFCETVVVSSNHDRHLERWLNEADFRADPMNAKYFCLLQYHVLDAMDAGDQDFSILEWALRREDCPSETHFLGRDESFVICKDAPSGGVECGLHGDEGPNGARGNTRNLTKLGRAVNKGHDHTAAIRQGVYSAGACSLRFPYMHGPTSHSISHIVTFENGARQIVTMYGGKYRA